MSNTKSFQDQAFVLHSVPYKETSLIVELFCREHGRLPVIAKGAKRPHSGLRAVLVSFQPLQVRFLGRSEVKTLTHAEWLGGFLAPQGRALFASYYLNELLMRGLGREDRHVGLFDLYAGTLQAMVDGEDMNICIRRFEVGLLDALGYGLDWRVDRHGQRIDAQAVYHWVDQEGWAHPDGGGVNPVHGNPVEPLVPGQTVLDIQAGQWSNAAASALKPVTRRLLMAHVAPNGLLSRAWMEQLIRS
ncbi:DNA repair protein RecO [Limnobacter sp.]|uniref:DNA repair protein RecO n=1 Tax=Limnobacter sp. TaxID=2003368 RepID=UPI0035110FBB